ncbi:hypothetical protein B4U80_03859 [Leptotrombidium deliense]|uniref:Uncharacterized protein n=1 Tax=Leptotrombidium deliense TaxID=299467 RepID=A0A443S0L0_9ACAR|nr:hypothetical protein B4U80_03859 [Leptotrombidium deliense]
MHWIGLLNSSLNPLLYTQFAKNIQTEFKLRGKTL